jgi:hypothetical protein
LIYTLPKRLPEIQEELQAIIQRTESDLRALPKPPSNDPVGEVHQLLDAFARDVAQHVEGFTSFASGNRGGADGLIQQVNKENRTFRHSIRRTAPHFRPYERDSDRPTPKSLPVPEFLHEEDAEEFKEMIGTPLYMEDIVKKMNECVLIASFSLDRSVYT